jgi:hypothetical protein
MAGRSQPALLSLLTPNHLRALAMRLLAFFHGFPPPIKPLTPRPTPSNLSTSATPILIRPSRGSLSRTSIGSEGSPRSAIGHVFSARLGELCVSALSFSAHCLSTFNCRLSAPSRHGFQRTSTLPPLIYGIIRPHRGSTYKSIRKRGGFSD